MTLSSFIRAGLMLACVLLAGCCPFGSEIRSRPTFVNPHVSPATSRAQVAACDRQGARLRSELERRFVDTTRAQCALPQPFADYTIVNAAGQALPPDEAAERRASHVQRLCAGPVRKDKELAALCPDCRARADDQVAQCRTEKGIVRSSKPVRMCSMIRF
ncbi:hypothetical protein [Stenotrophomonas sp.]|uniref:hypothetical protein n=1 Tax=Stenotrophomonas sp. TaxID=69392 RepID=UPI0028AD4649|nr:hypothetical protein [Stenotrophomonas sp.]